MKGGKRKAAKLSEKLRTLLHACTDSWLRKRIDSISTWRRCAVFFLSWRKVCKDQKFKKSLGVAMRLLGVTSAWPEHAMHTGLTVTLVTLYK